MHNVGPSRNSLQVSYAGGGIVHPYAVVSSGGNRTAQAAETTSQHVRAAAKGNPTIPANTGAGAASSRRAPKPHNRNKRGVSPAAHAARGGRDCNWKSCFFLSFFFASDVFLVFLLSVSAYLSSLLFE